MISSTLEFPESTGILDIPALIVGGKDAGRNPENGTKTCYSEKSINYLLYQFYTMSMAFNIVKNLLSFA